MFYDYYYYYHYKIEILIILRLYNLVLSKALPDLQFKYSL